MKHGTAVKGVAHRGFSSQAPENSRVAFAMAAEGDFYGIECDIWRTRDGQYVVSHDNQMERMYGQPWKITEKTYEEIRKYPMIRGSQAVKHPPQHMVLFTGYLSILAREETTHSVIELKMDYTAAQLREIVDLVKKYGLYDRTVFISLHPQVLVRLKEELHILPEHLQYVYGATAATKRLPVSMELEDWLGQYGFGLDARFTLITRGTVLRLHEKGLKVNVWTVNRPEDYEKMLSFGVDYITSNYHWNGIRRS